VGTLVYVPSVYFAMRTGATGVAVLDTVVLVAVLALLALPRLGFRVRAIALSASTYVLALGLLIWVGPISQIFMVCFSMLVMLLLGQQAGIAAAIVGSVTTLAISFTGKHDGELMLPTGNQPFPGSVVIALNFAFVNTLLTVGVGTVLAAIERALSREIATGQSLAAERTVLRTLLDALPDNVFTKDRDGRYVNANPAMVAAVGLQREDQLVGRRVDELIDADLAAEYAAEDRAVMEGHPLRHREHSLVDNSGAEIWYHSAKLPLTDASGNVVGLVGVSRNVTERKQLEETLRQAQKMESIGLLAGGVAHDFNNLLTVIVGYSEVLLEDHALDASQRESITAIREAGARAATLTHQLLAFSRQSILQPQVLDLNRVVNETGKMLRRLIGEDVAFVTDLAPSIDHVRVDPGQLDQVLMNIAVNARDAMPRGGTLCIATRNVTLDTEFVAQHPGSSAGAHVLLSLSDSGVGMTPAVLARMFDPFFTTKGIGSGTGLGLAMVFGIVQQSGGFIQVSSTPGVGSSFAIYLPAVTERQLAVDDGPARQGPRGTETVLVVEDDDAVRALVVSALRADGYHLLTAPNGSEALRLAEQHLDDIDVLLTDVVMPHMSGPALADAIHARMPGLPVLFMSGHTDDAVLRHGLLHADVALLQKPFDANALKRALRRVLDEERTANVGRSV
jgi:PAS domain S-box-containing protein